MKPSRLQEHLQKVHPDKQNKDFRFSQILGASF